MIKLESLKKHELIAAICYAIYAFYNIINLIIYVSRIIYVSNFQVASITALKIILCIAILGMAVTLFIKNEKAFVVAAGVNASLRAAGVNTSLRAYYVIGHFSFWNFFDLLAYVAVIIFIILTLKGNDVVKKIWFAPATMLLLGYIIEWNEYRYFSFFSASWKSMLFSIVEIVALLFVGMWVKEDVMPAPPASVNEYATFDPQTMYSASDIGGADKLKIYKELLESGIITQEEFDAKKKQILGL